MDQEGELVERLRAGDSTAFDAVYDAFNKRLFTFLLRLSRRRDVAEDLLEETWLRLVKHTQRLTEDTRLGPWLFTVARNLHVSYVRSRVLEDAATGAVTPFWPSSVDRPSPFEMTAAHELRDGKQKDADSRAVDSGERYDLIIVGGGLSGLGAAYFYQKQRGGRVLVLGLENIGIK